MKITFLGTNGWYNSSTGDTICILVEGQGETIILDAGSGFARLPTLAAAGQTVNLLLSHFHLDHISGLHVLGKYRFPGGLRLFAPTGGREVLQRFLAQPFTMPWDRLPYPVRLHELPEESGQAPWLEACREMRHTALTLGYRIRLQNQVVVYCPDTGYCDNALELARGADLLLAECAFRPGEEESSWPHLNPETAARLALQAGVKQLVLVHFDASRYVDLAQRDEAVQAARRIFPQVIGSRDGMVLEI
ncbi:MAG: ribonuclease Z [Magnetococcales bacterium]|nr:ribonuclease Z [Magnetococcales bacterium]MBF0114310.1 ribonuclease Z [Magnetococcales bacterium]